MGRRIRTSQPPSTINRTMTSGEWIMLLSLSVLWGGSFFFNGVAVRQLPPITIVVLRVGVATLILFAVLRVRGIAMPKERGVWGAFLAMGFLNNVVPFSLIVWGQTHIASGLASILNATTPLFTVMVAHGLTTDEKMTGNRLAGVVAGFMGVIVLVGPSALNGFAANTVAQLACLGAAFSYALAGVFGRRFKRMGIAPMATATGQVTASTVMLVPVALVIDRPWTLAMPDAATWGAILAIAALSTALAYVLYFRLLSTAGATNLLLVTFLVPVSAIILGILFLGENLDGNHVFGMLLIGGGLAAIDGRLFNRFGRNPNGVSGAGQPNAATDLKRDG